MAGYVSVPIYPTFNGDALRFILTRRSRSRACFVGKLDEVSSLKTGVPAGVPLISLPLAPALDTLSWDAAIAATAPLQGAPVRDGEELCTIIYTSGTTGNPKGVMHKFNALAWALSVLLSGCT